jgi:anti-anti-sigma factor
MDPMTERTGGWAVETEMIGDIAVLRLRGKFVFGERTDEFRRLVDDLLARGTRRFLVNLLQVPWLDSGAVSELFETNKKVKDAAGRLNIVVQGKPLDILTVLYVRDILPVHEDERAALFEFDVPGQ